MNRLSRRLRYFFLVLIRKDRSSHRVALGFAIGLFTAISPFLGLHTVMVLALAFLFRANKVVALAVGWVNNPVTMIPIYVPCYALGVWMVPRYQADWSHIRAFLHHANWDSLLVLGKAILIPFLVGSMTVALASGVLSYFAVRWLVERFQKRSRHSREQRQRERLSERPSIFFGSANA
ncbi:MAG: DUF2062 domain-containing protein [Spirochaetia bacterium]|nr:DUF2062 domain-containing protein [Spirochaetia bacterium]